MGRGDFARVNVNLAPMDPRLRLDISWADLAAAITPVRGEAKANIAALWPGRSALPSLSVRTAFDALLQTLAIAPGDEIVMSAVNIDSMAEIVRAHGAKPVPADIDVATLAPTSDSVRAVLSSRTRLILIAHLFGARVPMATYSAIKPPGALLVEDCAQGWGGGYRGAIEADVSLFSFGPIKRRTALGGAVAVFADDALAGRCAAVESGYPRLSEGWFLRRAAKFAALKFVSTPWLYGLVMNAINLVTGDAERVIGAAARGFPAGDLIRRLRMRPPHRLLHLLARRLEQVEDDAPRLAAAREVLAGLDPGMTSLGANAPSHHFWLLPLLVADPAAASRALSAHGFDATRGTTSLRALIDGAHPTPHAQRLISQILYLPPPWEMSASRRRRLIEGVREGATLPSARLE